VEQGAAAEREASAGPADSFRALVESSPDPLFVVADGCLRFVNPSGLTMLQATSVEQVLGWEPWAFVPAVTRPGLARRHARLLAGAEQSVRADDVVLAADGSRRGAETISTAALFDGESVVLVVARCAPEPRRAQDALTTAEQRFTEAFRLAPTGMLLLDERGTILDANAAAGVLAGIDSSGLIGRPSLQLLHPEDRALVRTWRQSLITGENITVAGERRVVRPDGSVAWVHASMALLPGDPSTFVVHLVDITERRETEARLAYQALHDPLTGLPNRALLFDRLAQAVRAALRDGPGVAVLYLDLDDFKTINDTRGHAAGDRVLVEVADRLSRVLRPADTVARLGGDEFAIVAAGLPEEAARELAGRVADAVTEPVPLAGNGGSVRVAASVGMAHSADVPLDVDALLSAADAAMYRRKQRAGEPRP
jgi:diguanylate cyclase (GGDEF)-like protein/PAS domain S-box-containing protein